MDPTARVKANPKQRMFILERVVAGFDNKIDRPGLLDCLTPDRKEALRPLFEKADAKLSAGA